MYILEKLKKHAFLILGGACLFIVGIIYVIAVRGGEEPYLQRADTTIIFSTEDAENMPAQIEYIIVHVAGQVAEPGVFSLPSDARVLNAVEAAGGLTEYASPLFNLAAPIADGALIIVPAYYEEAETTAAGIDASGRVNINTATYAELRTLPQIGTARAGAILAFRDAHGAFSQIEDIMLVHGIGDGIFNQLRDNIVVLP